MTGEKHKKAFMRWRKSLAPKTDLLVKTVLEILVPALESRGFSWSDSLLSFYRDQKFVDRADGIPMRRDGEAYWDVVSIDFINKTPKFSISFKRWTEAELKDKQIWMPCFLTKRKIPNSPRVIDFGFYWFDPFITQGRCEKTVQLVVQLLPQIDDYFISETIGPNVTEPKFMGYSKS